MHTTALLLILLLTLTACGGGEDSTATAAAAADPTEAPEAADVATTDGEVLTITAVDYAFEDVPAEIAAGTQLALEGAPDAEPHELVALRLPDDDSRPAEEILAAGPDGPPPGEFAGVLIAPPGGAPGFAPEGPVVLDEPGRYLFVCFIPTDTTPEAFAELAETGGTAQDLPPSGPPHFVQGMLADVTVTS